MLMPVGWSKAGLAVKVRGDGDNKIHSVCCAWVWKGSWVESIVMQSIGDETVPRAAQRRQVRLSGCESRRLSSLSFSAPIQSQFFVCDQAYSQVDQAGKSKQSTLSSLLTSPTCPEGRTAQRLLLPAHRLA